MTTGQKWLGLLLLQAGLLGGAYGSGRYPEWKKRQVFEESARKEKEQLEEVARRALLTTRARSMLMEAALAVQYHNNGMAFERVIRAQGAVQALKLPLQKEFDEISALLLSQKAEAMDKILALADKIEAPPRLFPPELTAAAKPAVALIPAAGQAALAAIGVPATPAGGPSPHPGATPPAPLSEAAPRPTAPLVVAPPVLATAPTSPPAHNAATESTIEQSRSALLAAKELLIIGSEPAAVIAKLAHAQVVLEEAGHPEFGDHFTAAIKAVRGHDEQKARTALDSVLTSLRSL